MKPGGTLLHLALLLALGLSACLGPDRVFSESALLLMVPAQRQESTNLCGLAAVDSLASFHSVTLDAPSLSALRSIATAEGLSGAELKSCLEKAGFKCHVFKGSLDDTPTGLLRHLKAGRPSLVMMGEEGRRHCVLVAGHDPERHLVALADPALGHVAMTEEGFLERWKAAGHFTLLALPRGGQGIPLATSP